jgi:hypothetical protein
MSAPAQASTATTRKHLFCPHSGYLLELDAVQGAAVCEASGYSIGLSGVQWCAVAARQPPPGPNVIAHRVLHLAELSHVQVTLHSDMEVRCAHSAVQCLCMRPPV